MLKRLLCATAMTALLASPLAATDIGAMTEGEREAFRTEIRNYLMEHPEVLLEAIAVLEECQAAEQAAGDLDLVRVNSEDIFNDAHSWVGGNPEGDLTLVEFVDYRCGYCRRAHPEVRELIRSDGNIRIIVKEFPILGEQSVLASRFAIAVKKVQGDDAYAEVNDRLMSLRGDVNETSLTTLSEELGFDTPAVFAEMNGAHVRGVIEANRSLAQRLQISGTPSFIFEDRMLRGYLPLDGMRAVASELRGG